MKKFLLLVLLSLFPLQAVTPAIYLHHERSTQAATEADCQNRELCLDRTNIAPLGRFNDGTLFHTVTQEKPNVNLTGTLGVTGAATLSNTLTLPLLSANRVPYTTTGGLVTSASTMTYDGTNLAVNNGTYSGTLGVTGLSTLGRLNVMDSSITLGDGVTKGTVLTIQGKTGFTNPYLFNTTTTAGQLDLTVNSGSNRTIGMTNIGAGTLSLIVEGTVTADSIISVKNQTRGTFTVTASGFTTTVSGTARWERNNETVTLCFPSLSGTSNQTFMQLTGIAAAIVPPTSTSTFNQVVPVTNSGTTAFGTFIWTPASATLDFKIDAALNPFTNSGTKGFSGFCTTYLLQ